MHSIVQPSLLIPKHFHHPQRKPVPMTRQSPFVPAAAPATSNLHSLWIGCAGHVPLMGRAICGLLCLASLNITFSGFIHAVACVSLCDIHSFSWPSKMPLCGCTTFSLSIRLLMLSFSLQSQPPDVSLSSPGGDWTLFVISLLEVWSAFPVW